MYYWCGIFITFLLIDKFTLINVSSEVKLEEFVNCIPFHLNISPDAIDEIDLSLNKLWDKFVLAHFELELYINAWFVAGDVIEQSVSAANVVVPLENVTLTHFEEDELYCQYM